MAHHLVIDRTVNAVSDGLSVARADGTEVARLHRAGDDLVVVARTGTKRDGVPILGGIEVVARGENAFYRARDVTFELRWEADVRRVASHGERCRCCAEAFDRAAQVALCDCGAAFCDECQIARVACHECGAPTHAAEAP